MEAAGADRAVRAAVDCQAGAAGPAGRRVRLIYGAMRDKAIDEISGVLFPLAQQVIVTAPRQTRALHPESIHGVAEHQDLRTAPNLAEAMAMVQDATAEDVIFITGSLYLVAEARQMLAPS